MILILYFYIIAPLTAVLALVFFRNKIQLRRIITVTASLILLTSIVYIPLRYSKKFIHKLDHKGRDITSSNHAVDLAFTFPRIMERDLRFDKKSLVFVLPLLLSLYFTTVLIVVETIGIIKRKEQDST